MEGHITDWAGMGWGGGRRWKWLEQMHRDTEAQITADPLGLDHIWSGCRKSGKVTWAQMVESLKFKLMLKGLDLSYSRMTSHSSSQGGFARCLNVIINSVPFHSQVSLFG